MSYFRRSRKSASAKAMPLEEQQAKINEVRKLIGALADRIPNFCSDACISRYLRARNWNAEKASTMLKENVKWRLKCKPECIRWDDIAHEAETGKIYRADYVDKYGRAVLVIRPGFQNTTSTEGQIKHLVYCMENAILSLTADQEQLVCLVDFQGWTMASASVKVTRETVHILEDCYPGRMGLGILYNPPKMFESFWKIVRPFLNHETYKKAKFVYADDAESQKIMTDLFDVDELESAFGGRNPFVFDFDKFAGRMREDDKKMDAFLNSGGSLLSHQERPLDSLPQKTESSEDSFSSAAASPKPEGTKSNSENEMQ